MRVALSLVAVLIAVGTALPGATLAAPAEPKVALIVGPAGEATEGYRALAEDAARVAERFTSNVVRVYSPEATWPAVQQALDGAAVVVYLGHGNGWPSRYRDSLFGGTQNGFGLNPVAGGGDEAYQYFGEDAIAADVHLAKNAVVLLHRLCYASGNTEPGLPEGTLEEAQQRVDNYAAGFVRAGAGAVVADAFTAPAWYMHRLLTGERSIADVWAGAPRAKGNQRSFESSRSDGYVAAMDPDRPDGGFYRSIVYRGDAGAGRLTATAPTVPTEPAEPTLLGSGLKIEMPYLKTRPIAGSAIELWIPYSTDNRATLDGLSVGIRWDPIDAEVPAVDGAALVPEPPADPSTGRFTFIEPEQIGSLVQPVVARIGRTRIRNDITVPDRPGRYRLVTTLHDRAGVAFDAATQALVPAMLVRISGELEADYLVAPSAEVARSGEFGFPVAVANVGSRSWGQVGDPSRRHPDERPLASSLVAHWVRLDAATGELPADVREALPAGFGLGATKRATLRLTAPIAAGTYLLVIDVVVEGVGSLTAQGAAPALVRVTVE